MPEPTRRNEMQKTMVAFIKDESRWVRKAMFQNMGAYIATLPDEDVTEELVGHYRSMVAPEAVNEEKDLVLACAYSLPAVAVKIGARRWVELRGSFDILVSSDQWKVRKCLAHGLHELARILGPDLAEVLLVPVFKTFLKDLDEVKSGIIRSLGKFFVQLNPPARVGLLPALVDACSESNMSEWRMQKILAGQLIELCVTLPAEAVHTTLLSLGMRLWMAQVAEVRHACRKIPGSFYTCLRGQPEWESELMAAILRARQSQSWVPRQVFAYTCVELVGTLQVETVKTKILPDLISLKDDRVANVRMGLAEAMKICVGHDALLRMPEVGQCVDHLLRDEDRDVRDVARVALDIADGMGGLRLA